MSETTPSDRGRPWLTRRSVIAGGGLIGLLGLTGASQHPTITDRVGIGRGDGVLEVRSGEVVRAGAVGGQWRAVRFEPTGTLRSGASESTSLGVA